MEKEITVAAGRPARTTIHLTRATINTKVGVAFAFRRETRTCARATHSALANAAREAILARRRA